MKKKYVTPLTENMMMEENSMVCASIMNGGGALDNDINSADSRMMSEEDLIEHITGFSSNINNLLGI